MILLTALEAWFTNTPANFSKYPTQYSHLIQQHTQISWRQLFNGHLSTEWLQLQDEHLHQQGLHNKKTTGLLWATTILSKIWEEWTLIWTICNQVMQGHDQTSRLNIQRLEAETELRAIYDDRELLLPADRDHLFGDVSTHLAYSTNSIQNWLNTYQGLFTDSISKAKKCTLEGVHSIRSYFQPA
jgi:hypothetical protein